MTASSNIRFGAGWASESLVACVDAVLCGAGRSAPAGEIAFATGVAAMAAIATEGPCAARWGDHGRHAFLEAAGLDYGLTLRDLHPPAAAPLPDVPEEFEWHFRDSYLPLIETALAHRQPVLAWMGWPPPHDGQWGIIDSIDAQARTCIGRTPGGDREPAPLARAAVQVYVVTNTGGAIAPLSDRLAAGLQRTQAVLHNELPAAFGVATGGAAIERLREFAAHTNACPLDGRPAWQCARDAAIRLLERRQALASFARSASARDEFDAALRAALSGLAGGLARWESIDSPPATPAALRDWLGQTLAAERALVEQAVRAE